MPVYRDYEIRMNLNELIEKRVPCCDLLHPDHCFTESQVTQIAHDINMDFDLEDAESYNIMWGEEEEPDWGDDW